MNPTLTRADWGHIRQSLKLAVITERHTRFVCGNEGSWKAVHAASLLREADLRRTLAKCLGLGTTPRLTGTAKPASTKP